MAATSQQATATHRAMAGAARAAGRPASLGVAGSRASAVMFAGVCLLAAFAPLAFGSVESWARLVVFAIVLALLLAWFAGAVAAGRLVLRRTVLYAPLAAFLAWAAAPLVLHTTFYPHATGEELLWAATLALTWIAVFNGLNARELARLPLFLCFFGFALALFAILQGLATPHDTIFGFRKLSEGPTAYGPFVNKNHYAAYMEILLPLPLGLALLGGVARARRPLFAFMGAVMGVSVALSLSRAGLLVVGAQLAFLVVLAGLGARRPRALVLALLLTAGAGAAAAVIGGRALAARTSTLLAARASEPSIAARVRVARDSLSIVRDHPVWGTGLGTYAWAYPRYKSFDDNLLWEHAHNDLIEAAADTGPVGMAMLLLFLGGLWGVGRDGIRTLADPGVHGDQRRRGALLAVIFTGCAGVLLHSLVDFNFHIPAIALTVSILYATGLALRSTDDEPAEN